MANELFVKCLRAWITAGLMWEVSCKYIQQQNPTLETIEPGELELFKKIFTDLLLSEYNRVTTTNRNLYVVSREPTIFCEENDLSNCFLTFEVVPSVCPRLSSWNDNCKPLPGSDKANSKICVGSINLLEVDITGELSCHGGFDRKYASDDVGLKTLLSSWFDGSPQTFSKSNKQIMKKQWSEDTGGNIYPMK